ncbi:MAG: DUF3088 family protein [Parvularcula sp.]
MSRDILFLLPPGFEDEDRFQYCPECAEVWGLLHYFPAIKEALDIRYMDIHRPRTEMVGLLGTAHQNCPTLVLQDASPHAELATIGTANGYRFVDNARDIGKYWAERYGLPGPRGG